MKIDITDSICVTKVADYWVARAGTGEGAPIVSNDFDLGAMVVRLHRNYPREPIVILPARA